MDRKEKSCGHGYGSEHARGSRKTSQASTKDKHRTSCQFHRNGQRLIGQTYCSRRLNYAAPINSGSYRRIYFNFYRYMHSKRFIMFYASTCQCSTKHDVFHPEAYLQSGNLNRATRAGNREY